jgi:hypothetical protein
MIKLYKRDGAQTRYWEAWSNAGIVIIHWGQLGDKGRVKQVRLKKGQKADSVIKEAARQFRGDGFRAIPTGKHAEVVVQYRTEGWGSVKDLEKRHKIEDIFNECLGWTGNGHCDGGDIGSGSINIFSLVVDSELAKETIIAELKKKRLLKGAVIAVWEDDDYTVVWPESYGSKFSIL